MTVRRSSHLASRDNDDSRKVEFSTNQGLAVCASRDRLRAAKLTVLRIEFWGCASAVVDAMAVQTNLGYVVSVCHNACRDIAALSKLYRLWRLYERYNHREIRLLPVLGPYSQIFCKCSSSTSLFGAV
jgi:hypothetical protein